MIRSMWRGNATWALVVGALMLAGAQSATRAAEPERGLGQDCGFPMPIWLEPGALPYAEVNSTCGLLDVYNQTCLGDYDEGEDFIYELNVLVPMTVRITLDPMGNGFAGLALDAGCPPGGVCLAQATNATPFDPVELPAIQLDAGLYTLMVDTPFPPGCLPEFMLIIESASADYFATFVDDDPQATYEVVNLPAEFFGPGCAPFAGPIYFKGEPLDEFTWGETDTRIERQGDPVLPDDPVGTIGTVGIELAELQLTSVYPIIVGCNDESTLWTVSAGPSPSTPAPVGTMTATKTHENGGTFDSTLFVQPEFVFTRIGTCGWGGDHDGDGDVDLDDYAYLPACFGGPGAPYPTEAGCCSAFDFDGDLTITLTDVREFQLAFSGGRKGDAPQGGEVIVFDTGAAGELPLQFQSLGVPFVHFLYPEAGVVADEGALFVAGVEELVPGLPDTQVPVVFDEIASNGQHRGRPARKKRCIYEVICVDGACQSCELREGDLCQRHNCPNNTCPVGFEETCGDADCCLEYTLKACRYPNGEPQCPTGEVCECDPQEGACCDSAGACTVESEADCVDGGGQYVGDGEACSPNPCCACTTTLGSGLYPPGATLTVTKSITNTSPKLTCTFNWTVAKTQGTPTVNPLPPSGAVTLAPLQTDNTPQTYNVPANTAARDTAQMTLTVTGGSGCQAAGWVCVMPTDESTASNGWSAGNATIHLWEQTLQPTTADFATRQVTEFDGGGGNDTCWFAGSAYLPFDAITGGTWTVQASNIWGDDHVGWFPAAVTYYRNQGRAPCGTSFQQIMKINCPPFPTQQYTINTLTADIGVATVGSGRDGQSATRNWP